MCDKEDFLFFFFSKGLKFYFVVHRKLSTFLDVILLKAFFHRLIKIVC